MSTPQSDRDPVAARRRLFDTAVADGELAIIRSVIRVLTEEDRAAMKDSLSAALHAAVLGGDAETTEALLHAGASPNHRSISGHTPAFWAVENVRTDLLHLLVEHGATFGVNRRDAELMQRAVLRGDPDPVEILIHAGAPLQGVRDHRGASLLHIACRYDHADIAEQLLRQGLRVDAIDVNGLTPLHYAGESATASTAGLLLQRGADINSRSNSGLTPILAAAISGRPEGFRALLAAGADPLARTNSDSGAFEVAMAYVRDDMAVWLLEEHPMLAPTGSALDDAFVNAVRKGCAGVVKKLAELGADVGQKPGGRTLLQCAPAKAEDVRRVLRALKTGAAIAGAMHRSEPDRAAAGPDTPSL